MAVYSPLTSSSKQQPHAAKTFRTPPPLAGPSYALAPHCAVSALTHRWPHGHEADHLFHLPPFFPLSHCRDWPPSAPCGLHGLAAIFSSAPLPRALSSRAACASMRAFPVGDPGGGGPAISITFIYNVIDIAICPPPV